MLSNKVEMNRIILVKVFLNFCVIPLVTLGQHRCSSVYGPQLSFPELHECLSLFCFCNRHDNCSQLSPIEDVMVMLMNEMNGAVMCADFYGKQNEPNGRTLRWDGDYQDWNEIHEFGLIKETDEMYRITIKYGYGNAFRKTSTIQGKHNGWPVKYHNIFHGMNMNTSGLMTGELRFRNSRESLPSWVDRINDWFEPYYFMVRWVMRRKERFADRPTIETNTQLMGPTGQKALRGFDIRQYGFAMPVADINSLVDTTFHINYVIPQNDLVVFRSFDMEASLGGNFILSICMGKALDASTGNTYWTSRGCRPILNYKGKEKIGPFSHRSVYIGPAFTTEVICECHWQTEPPSHPAVSGQSSSNKDKFSSPDREWSRDSRPESKTINPDDNSDKTGLVLSILLLIFCLIVASVFTFLLMLELNK